MSLDWRVVPLKQWPGELTKERKGHRFSTSRYYPSNTPGQSGWTRRVNGVDWVGTVQFLEKELGHLDADNIVLQMNVTSRDIRNDGWIRADARPTHPGVILTFSSRTLGPLSYPCDTYDDWQANVRAIALSLEALRAVDRHGVTKRGEQYTGFKQIGAGGKLDMTPQLAAEILADQAQEDFEVDDVLYDPALLKYVVRYAVKKAHPDAGGSAESFVRVQEAKAVLERYHGLEGK